MSTANPTIHIKADDPDSMDRELEQATALLRENAAGCGIVVTRVDFATFIVTLSPDIAFGLTREVDLLCGHARARYPTKSSSPGSMPLSLRKATS